MVNLTDFKQLGHPIVVSISRYLIRLLHNIYIYIRFKAESSPHDMPKLICLCLRAKSIRLMSNVQGMVVDRLS